MPIVLIALGIFRFAADTSTWFDWVLIGASLIIFVMGLMKLRAYRIALHKFEAEHGRDAGRQF